MSAFSDLIFIQQKACVISPRKGKPKNANIINTEDYRAGQTLWQLRALAALAMDLVCVPNTHVGVHNHL